MLLNLPTAPGEFLDRLTILEIKSERIEDPDKLANVRRELDLMRETWSASPLSVRDVESLVTELKSINASLWDIEDQIREHEARQDFGAGFIELARSVYRTNDRRAAVKRELNVRLGSEILEEKSYKEY